MSRSLYYVPIAAALLIAAPANAGHWHFRNSTFSPPQVQLDAVKAMPGHVYEKRVSGAFDPSGHATINLFFKTDDADLKVYVTTQQCTFNAVKNLLDVTPGQTLRFKAIGQMTANAGNPSGACKLSADNGDYVIDLSFNHLRKGNGAGDLLIPKGAPGSTLTIHANAYMANLGAFGETLDIVYDWIP